MSVRHWFFGLLAMLPVLSAAELHVVVVEGLGGNDIYGQQFATQADAIAGALAAPDSTVTVFRDGDYGREDIIGHFRELASRAAGDDRVAFFLVGHGSYDDHEYKFNIRGPDLTGTDIADALDALPARNQLLVNTSSASGATRERLESDNRTLILATRSGAERHATRFGHYFAIALSDGAADLDKNQAISAEEAFRYAERQVADYFERNGQLATEHPRLEGELAARFSLSRLGAQRPAPGDAELDRLVRTRDRLTSEIEELRLRRDAMSAGEYQSEQLRVMLELATVEEQIERREAELDNE